MKKSELPKDWIVVKSISHPDRIYYFNVKTNEKSWTHPSSIKESEDANGVRTPSTKRRRSPSNDNASILSRSPDHSPPPLGKRQKLKARRSLSSSEKSNPSGSSIETPIMKALREKMLSRQSKGNATKKHKVTTEIETNNTVEKTKKIETESKSEREKKENTRQSLTPAMQVLREKIDARKSIQGSGARKQKPEVSTPKKTTPEIVKSPRQTRSRAKSMGVVKTAIDKSPPSTSMTPRRSNVPVKQRKSISQIEIDLADEKTEKNFPITNQKIGSGTPVGKKNTAQERYEKLRKSLVNGDEKLDSSQEIAKNLKKTAEESPIQKKYSPPNVYKNATARMKALNDKLSLAIKRRNRRTIDSILNTEEESQPSSSTSTSPNKSTNDYSDSFCEQMEWETIEDEAIMTEIEAVRIELSSGDLDVQMEEPPENSLDLTDGLFQQNRKELYIVVDTNVFLSNLAAVGQARDAEFRCFGRPIIVVPWTVIRELDYIKDDKSNSRPEGLKMKARQAVRFLHDHFQKKHPRVLGQTPRDVAMNREKFVIDCPDDEILQACLQIRNTPDKSVVLLSYDKNLCNKAMIHDIATIGRTDPLEKIDYLNACEVGEDSFFAARLRGNGVLNESLMTIADKELIKAGELYEEIKSILTAFLTVIVAKEMKDLFGSQWEKHVLILPPWTANSVLKCAIKHWIAAISNSFIRRAEGILKKLDDLVKSDCRELRDVENFIEICWDLVQCLQTKKYTNFVGKFADEIQAMRVKCYEMTKNIQEERLRTEISCQNDNEIAEERANAAFGHFEKVYEHARDICGIACEYIGMPCSFDYRKLNPAPSADEVKRRQPEVAAYVIQLLSILGTALEESNILHPAHVSVRSLYDALESLYSIAYETSQDEISPLDVYYCLKRKDKNLRAGLKQLQDLSMHFCRMANFRCK